MTVLTIIIEPMFHHKKGKLISEKEHRYLMTFLATAANPFFEVSRTEIDRPGASYAIDTVQYIKNNMAYSGQLYFITGADAILEIITWKDVDKLLDYCTFIAATRPGYNLDELKEKVLKKLTPKYLSRIIHLEVPAMAISSTGIREKVRLGKTIKYLLPEAVENYIIKNDLYKK